MIAVATQKLKKSYGADPVLHEITMEVIAGDRIGIVGPNGAGKTTLFELLAGLETPDEGGIFRAKGSRWAYLPQNPVYPENWNGRDVIASAFAEVMKVQAEMRQVEQDMALAGDDSGKLEKCLRRYQQVQEQFEQLDGYQVEATMSQVITGLGIADAMLDTPFRLLSGGEKTKIGLAKLLCEKSDVLLLDEPTNHLDVESMEWLEGFLRDYPGTILLISHDRYFLDRVVTGIFEVDGGELEVYQGNYSTFLKEKEERLLRQFAEYEEQQKKIKKMQETIKRLIEWGNRTNPSNEAFHRRAKSMEKALARIERIERPKLEADRMGLEFKETHRSGQDVLVAEGIGKAYDGKILFRDAHLLLRYGERKALLGPNGCGKSTFIKMLLGEVPPDAGTIRLGSNVKVGYLSQQALEGDPNRRVIDVFRETVTMTEGEARQRLARFLFYGEQVFKKVSSLSGGERMRLRLAQLMHQEINLLILDEPTNHLDIVARETLEEAVAEFRGSLLIVSHDRYFLQQTVDGVFWVDQGKLIHYAGRYEEAREKRKQLADTKAGDRPKKAEAKPARAEKTASPAPKPPERPNPHKLAELEQRIAAAEQERSDWMAKMEQLATDYQALADAQLMLELLNDRLERLYSEWVALQEAAAERR